MITNDPNRQVGYYSGLIEKVNGFCVVFDTPNLCLVPSELVIERDYICE